jgi:error-prone DNA polymerase
VSVTPSYVELHCHSGYSFLDGASHPEELVLKARELGYPALALTDHNGLYGSMEFAQQARAEGLQPITGAELTIRDSELDALVDEARRAGEAKARRRERGEPMPRRHSTPDASPRGPDVGNDLSLTEITGGFDPWAYERPGDTDPLRVGTHVTLLAENPIGYANLCRLLSEAHLRSPRRQPSLPLSSLLERAEGLILLTGCRRSPLFRALESSEADADALARRLVGAFGPGNVFVELQDNRGKGDGARNRALGRLATRLGLPAVATGNVHYHRPGRHRLQDVLVSIRNRSTLDGSHGMRRPNRLFHLASAQEMTHRFQSRPDALRNTLLIAERCARFDLTHDLGYEFPDFEGSELGSATEVLGAVCEAALDEKYPSGSKHRDEAARRLLEELNLVDHHGLAGFFLVYRDIMNLAREVGARVRGTAPRARSNLPPGRGRGSSVSSIICYLIGLSHIDPVANDLFLGRFLNEALRTVPDIDLDFPRDIREELILEVYRRYGNAHAGLVCTFPTYRIRSAVREIGKSLDLPAGELEKLSKLAEHRSAAGLKEELENLPEFKERSNAPLWQALGALAEGISGLPRHISQHVGGMIISSRPLVEIVPLEPAAWEGRVLCQWDKDSCDDAGFIKIDFLALGMLSLVEEATDLIHERDGATPDLSRIDFEDPVVYDRICSGDTVGMFQVESRAQIQMLRRTKPRDLDELAIQVAIVRPGPIVGGAVNPYVRRREMLRENPDFEVPYEHPLLEEALGETLGVIIFQDQVLKVCQALAGFSDGQAEGLRRAMSRKRSRDALLSYWEAFREGAARNGVDEITAQTVFQQVVAFSEFGFPKSHAAAFGLLAYQSAWLRHYHPVEYYVALFNNQPMGFYSLDALGRDARRNGIDILLPDINRSRVRCTAEGDDLRVGLGFVRGWGADIAQQVVEERERRGPFRALPDFLRRTPALLKRPAVENLIWVGGFDGLGLSRRELLWQAGLWLGPESDESRRSGGRDDHPQTELALGDAYMGMRFPDLGDGDRMLAEYRMLRFSTRLHPLQLLRHRLPPGTITSDRLPHLKNGTTVRVAGVVVARQRPQTAKGYVFVLMEDEGGHINAIVKPPIYERDRSAVRMEPFVWVQGRLQKDGDTVNVIAHRVTALRVEGAPGADRAMIAEANRPLGRPPSGRGRGRNRDEPSAVEQIGGNSPTVQQILEGWSGAVPEPDALPDPSSHASAQNGVSAETSSGQLAPLMPGALEWWADPDRADPSPFKYLTALRQSPPGVKSFG